MPSPRAWRSPVVFLWKSDHCFEKAEVEFSLVSSSRDPLRADSGMNSAHTGEHLRWKSSTPDWSICSRRVGFSPLNLGVANDDGLGVEVQAEKLGSIISVDVFKYCYCLCIVPFPKHVLSDTVCCTYPRCFPSCDLRLLSTYLST